MITIHELVNGFLADLSTGARPDALVVIDQDGDRFHIATRGYDPEAGAIILTIGEAVQ